MANLVMDLADRPAIILGLVLPLVYSVYQLFLKPANLPDIPIIGSRKGDWFPLLQAKIRNSLDMKKAVNTAYYNFKDQATILPIIDGGNLIMLPRSDTKFASEQAENVLSVHEQSQELLQTDYTTMDPSLTHDPLHLELIVTTLTKEVGNLVPDLADEIAHCFDQYWGSSAEFKEVCIYTSMQQVLSGVTNRAFVSLPLCRNQDMLKTAIAFAGDIPFSSLLVKAVPKFLRPVVAPFITLPNRLHTWQFEKMLAPEIKARLAEYDNPKREHADAPRNDFLQWSIAQAKRKGDPKNWSISALAQRVLLLNFAAIHTSTFAITHALLDLAACGPGIMTELREEVERVLESHDGQWSKRALAQMEKLDSAIRESQRKNSFVVVGVSRTVMAEKGLTFPSGIHLRKGLTMAVPGYPVHQDETVYPDAKTYQPLRFYNARINETEHVKSARNAFPTATMDFLGWGLGRGSCPGRFFASNEIKMMMAYILLNYDIEKLSSRPRNMWIAQNRIPPMKATIKIRKRPSRY